MFCYTVIERCSGILYTGVRGKPAAAVPATAHQEFIASQTTAFYVTSEILCLTMDVWSWW